MSGYYFKPKIENNRIPDREELLFLRSAALHKQEVIDQLIEKKKAAQKVYTDVKFQYNAQIIVLERLQSRLDLAEVEVESYEKHVGTLIKEMNHLQGQLHPIRRCPDDILREIFGQLVHSYDEPFLAASQLSHVCQRWRALAISMPSLWNRVTFKTEISTTKMTSISRAFATRVKHVAAEVTIIMNAFKMKPVEFQRAMRNFPLNLLYSIPSLSTLTIHMKNVNKLREEDLLNTIWPFPSRELQRLVIKNYSHDLNPLLANFLLLRDLDLSQGNFESKGVLGLERTLSTLVKITLSQVFDIPLLSFLRMTPLLQMLEIAECDLKLPHDQLEDLCLLKNLTYIDISLCGCVLGREKKVPWERIKCPVLKRIRIHDGIEEPFNDSFWEFLSATATILDVEIVDCIEIQAVFCLAKAVPQITKLTITGSVDILPVLAGSDQSGLEGPAFPYLNSMDIWLDDTMVTANHLRELVYIRCLPRDHAQNIMNPQIEHPVGSLTITIERRYVELKDQAEEFLQQYFEPKGDVYKFVQTSQGNN